METQTPLWLGLIIVLMGYFVNILQKMIDIKTNNIKTNNKDKFSFLLWWRTNKLNTFLSFVVIALLLLVYPDISKLLTISGNEMLGERAMYAIIGYSPLKMFQTFIKKANIQEEKQKLNI